VFRQLIPPTVITWLHAIFFNLVMLYPDSVLFLILDYCFLLLIFIYELISVSFSGMDYFKSMNNILDLLIIFLCAIMNIFTFFVEGWNNVNDNTTLKYFQVITLFIVYYRALTFLWIFKLFRHVIDLIIGITISTISLLCISAIFIFVISICFIKAKEGNDGFWK